MIRALLGWVLATNTILIDPTAPPNLVIIAYIAIVAGWFGIVCWAFFRGTKPTLLLLLWLLLAIVSLPTDTQSIVELLRLLGYVALFGLGLNANDLRRWSDWLLPAALLWAMFSNANPNDISMMLWTLTILSNYRWLYAVAVGVIMLVLGSEGAFIALAVALAVERFGWRAMIPAPPAMLVIGLWRGAGSSAGVRFDMWLDALKQFSFWGNGLPFRWQIGDQVFGYTHNLPVTVAYLAGVPGLLALAGALWWLWSVRHRLGQWSGIIAGFMIYSLMDYPHWSIPGVVMMIISGGIDNGITMGRRINVFGFSGVDNRIGVCSGPGLVAKPDPHRAG